MCTDYQSSVSIMKRRLHVVARHLQRMMIRLQKNDFVVRYMPGKDIALVDTLCRTPISGASTKVSATRANAQNPLKSIGQ